MPGRNALFVPGPTNTPDRILRAMHRAMEDHRSSSFPALARPILSDLRRVFRTEEGQCFVFPATGTGMWEAALANTLSPGDRVLASRYGQFGHLFIDCAQRLGLRVDTNHEIKGVLVVHNETATGVTSDIAAVRRAIDAAQHPALLYVDTVSGLVSLPFEMDAWGVDAAITGSQKGFMLPAGLGLLGMSRRALARRESARCARVFFDLGDMIAANASGYFPYTPSLPLLYGLRESLDLIFEEGLDAIHARHHRLADGCRAAVRGWGLSLCAKEPRWASDTVSAVVVPPGIDGADVIDVAFRRYDLALGAGLGEVAGRVFRIGHLGDLNELMLLGALAGVELAMRDVGIPVALGSGVAAAQEAFRATAAPLAPRAGSPDAQARATSPSRERMAVVR